VEIRGLSLGAGYVGHACDWAVGHTRALGELRGLKVIRSDVWCEKKSGGSLKGRRGIVTVNQQCFPAVGTGKLAI
jgi:hypothetical protein